MGKRTYTEEQLLWIKDNYSNFTSVNQATNEFNKKFDMNITNSAMTTKAKRLGCKKMNCFYSEEQILWIKGNYNKYLTRKELTEAYNANFNERKTIKAIQFQCGQLGLLESFGLNYTLEQNQWLLDNFEKYTWNDLSEIFNKIFKVESTEDGLRNHCRDTLHLKRTKSHVVIRNKKYKVGDEVKYNNGYTYIKIKEYEKKGEPWTNKKARECWKSKQSVIWEKYYKQLVPDDCQIVFLNNNREDFRIENLYCIKKQYLVYMIRNHWFSDDPNITLTAIKWCELIYATK